MQISYLSPNEELLDALTKASALEPVQKTSKMKNFVKYPRLENIPQTTRTQQTSSQQPQPQPIIITSDAHWKFADFGIWAEQSGANAFTGCVNGGIANANGYLLNVSNSSNFTWSRLVGSYITINIFGLNRTLTSSSAQDLLNIYIYLRYTFTRISGAPFACSFVATETKSSNITDYPLALATLNKANWTCEFTNFGNVRPIYFTSTIYPA